MLLLPSTAALELRSGSRVRIFDGIPKAMFSGEQRFETKIVSAWKKEERKRKRKKKKEKKGCVCGG